MATSPSTLFIQRGTVFKTINGVGNTLKRIGLDPFSVNAAKIIEKARKRAQYDEAIPAQVETGIHKLVHSMLSEGRPNAFAKLAANNLFERTIYGRFKVEQELAANPHIELSAIKEPVFIIGMPRTGTTILHALMHEDPAHRSPLAWECLLPHPVPQPENFSDNPQLATVTKEFDQLFKLVPDFQRKHHMAADAPQECISINALDFTSFQPAAQYYLPSYMEWFNNEADQLTTMRFHKRFLQYLQSGGVKGNRWLLKTPVHMMRLKEIFEVYPDAKIIMTHRPPNKVVASSASLISSVRSLYSDYEDPIRTGDEQANTWSMYFDRFLDNRRRLNKEDQIIDLKFEDFVIDQLNTVIQIYERFGWELSHMASVKMKKFLQQNPKDKHGVHQYSIADFGISEKRISQQFSNYNDFLAQL